MNDCNGCCAPALDDVRAAMGWAARSDLSAQTVLSAAAIALVARDREIHNLRSALASHASQAAMRAEEAAAELGRAQAICRRCGEDASLIDQDPDVPDLWETITTPNAWAPDPHMGVIAVHLILMALADRRGVVKGWHGALMSVFGAVEPGEGVDPYSWTVGMIERLVIGPRGLVGRGLAEESGPGELRLLGGAS